MTPAIKRFLSKINVVESDCWEWTARISTTGYGRFRWGKKMGASHRFIYEYYYGEINSTLVIDHLCRNSKCVNPLHLEQVTQRENLLRGICPTAINARKTHCIHGHEFTPENTYIRPNRKRECRACNRKRTQLRRI